MNKNLILVIAGATLSAAGAIVTFIGESNSKREESDE